MKKLLLLVLISNMAFGQIKVTDLTKIKNVTDIKVNGNQVVYTLKTINETPEKPFEYDYITQLYFLNLNSPTNHKALTSSKESSSQPEFSPDGKNLAFVRNVNDKPQIFIIPLDGGEARQITTFKYGASNPKYSVDGKTLYFNATLTLNELYNDSLLNENKSIPEWSLEKPGMKNNELFGTNAKANPDGNLNEIRAYLDKNVSDKKAKVINRLNFLGESQVEPEIKFTHIFSVEVDGKSRPKMISNGYYSYTGINLVNDGKNIICTSASNTKNHPDRDIENKIVSIDIASKNQVTILEQKGKSFSNISVSPNNKSVAFVINDVIVMSYGKLGIADITGSNSRISDFDRSPQQIEWSNDAKFIYFVAPANGAFPVFRTQVSDFKTETLTDYDSGYGAFEILPNGGFICTKNNIENPQEMYLADENLKQLKQISSFHADWLKDIKLSKPEKRSFKNSKGQYIDYWIMKPTNFNDGQKYPLMLQMHGGPTAMWGPGEASMWHEFQYFCTMGYGIVYLNQRGSGGYGKDFQFSNYRDWGNGPQEDALTACSLAEKETWVNPNKLVITGGSYAGYLTAWIVGHDHRFKAAFSQRGVYDLTTFMGEGNAWRLLPMYFGLPWQDEKITKIKANSPYTFVDKIKTPLLIKHGENDLRTGVIQSEMMYKSLKYLEKEVEYVRMPGATHELSRTGNVRQRIDRILRIHEFFQRYIK